MILENAMRQARFQMNMIEIEMAISLGIPFTTEQDFYLRQAAKSLDMDVANFNEVVSIMGAWFGLGTDLESIFGMSEEVDQEHYKENLRLKSERSDENINYELLADLYEEFMKQSMEKVRDVNKTELPKTIWMGCVKIELKLDENEGIKASYVYPSS